LHIKGGVDIPRVFVPCEAIFRRITPPFWEEGANLLGGRNSCDTDEYKPYKFLVQAKFSNLKLSLYMRSVYYAVHFPLRNIQISTKFANFVRLYFPRLILQHFAAKLCNFTNFNMLFLAVVHDCDAWWILFFLQLSRL
jgi:hypothetical protein